MGNNKLKKQNKLQTYLEDEIPIKVICKRLDASKKMSASPIGKKYIASIRTENLQDYLNWIVYKSTINSKNIEEKIEKLVDTCFQSRVIYRIKDRY